MTSPTGPLILHASCVAFSGQGVVLIGASGSGKSSLALQLMALGAQLVADDRVWIFAARNGQLTARAPKSIKGLIEARGVGILRANPVPSTQIAWIIDLDQIETQRLPPVRHKTLLGHDVPLLHAVPGPQFASAIVHLLRHGRRMD